MEEVPWRNLEAGKEYYIESILPTRVGDYGTPMGRKKKGIFVRILYDRGTPFTMFRNLIEPPRDIEGPYLPSSLGSHEENIFSINVHRFYNVLPQDLRDKVRNSDIEEYRLRKYLADEVVGNIPDLTNEVEKYGLKGGKKARRNKKSKRTKKSKRSKKSKKNKTRKNKKMIGGGRIREITEDANETEFEQRNAVINYGYGPVSTYNLVNCIAIGGVFELEEKRGTFLTHEAPLDYLEQQHKLINIKRILNEKNAKIINIVIFRIDKPATDVYENGLTTTKVIDLMSNFSEKLFSLIPIIINYSCDISKMRCGKAIISPTGYNSYLTEIRFDSDVFDSDVKPSSSETFIVEVLHDAYGEKIYSCPFCKRKTGTSAPKNPTNTSLFSHIFDCPNKNKIPIEA